MDLAACLPAVTGSVLPGGRTRLRLRVVRVGPAFNSLLSALIAPAASSALPPAGPQGPPGSHCRGLAPRHSCCSAASRGWSWMSGRGAEKNLARTPQKKSPPPWLAGREHWQVMVRKKGGATACSWCSTFVFTVVFPERSTREKLETLDTRGNKLACVLVFQTDSQEEGVNTKQRGVKRRRSNANLLSYLKDQTVSFSTELCFVCPHAPHTHTHTNKFRYTQRVEVARQISGSG